MMRGCGELVRQRKHLLLGTHLMILSIISLTIILSYIILSSLYNNILYFLSLVRTAYSQKNTSRAARDAMAKADTYKYH